MRRHSPVCSQAARASAAPRSEFRGRRFPASRSRKVAEKYSSASGDGGGPVGGLGLLLGRGSALRRVGVPPCGNRRRAAGRYSGAPTGRRARAGPEPSSSSPPGLLLCGRDARVGLWKPAGSDSLRRRQRRLRGGRGPRRRGQSSAEGHGAVRPPRLRPHVRWADHQQAMPLRLEPGLASLRRLVGMPLEMVASSVLVACL